MRGIAKGRALAFALIMLVSLLAGTSLIPSASAAVLYVGGVGPGNYTTIQAAVDAANPGDTVYVYSGVYKESVSISKPLTLVGRHAETTEIRAENRPTAVFVSESHVEVSGFTIGGSSDKGLVLHRGHDCRFANNTFHGDIQGITLRYSSHNTIEGNAILKGLSGGIRVLYSDANVIQGNSISQKERGIRISYSDGSSILGNVILETDEGIELAYSYDAEIVGNRVSGSGSYGIALFYSGDAQIRANTVSDYGDGILSWYPRRDILITGNLISDNDRGVYAGLASAVQISVTNNRIMGNSIAGIRLLGTHDNLISGNTIGHNVAGVEIDDPRGSNWVYHNNFIENGEHACDDNLNGTWDDGYPSGGNYWDDYTGEDEFSGPYQDRPGRDGIGDTPRVVPPCAPDRGDPADRYPLMRPYAPHSPPVGLYGTLQSDGMPVPLPQEYGLSGIENITVNRKPPGGGGGSRTCSSAGHEDCLPEPGVGVPFSTAFESRVSGTGSIGTSTQTPDWGATWARSDP
ncbi:MAG: NosD domain-containing protein [Thermoplasmata archaeon]